MDREVLATVPWLNVTDADRAALIGLLDAARALSGADAAWWQDDADTPWPAERAHPARAPTQLCRPAAPPAPEAPALSLVLAGGAAPRTGAPLQAIVDTAQALLAARAAARGAAHQAERLLDAGRAATDWPRTASARSTQVSITTGPSRSTCARCRGRWPPR